MVCVCCALAVAWWDGIMEAAQWRGSHKTYWKPTVSVKTENSLELLTITYSYYYM